MNTLVSRLQTPDAKSLELSTTKFEAAAGQVNAIMSVSPDTTNGGLSCGTLYTANPPSGNWFTCAWTTQIVSDTTAATIEIRTPRDALRKSDRHRLRTGQIRLIGFAPSELSNACANAGWALHP